MVGGAGRLASVLQFFEWFQEWSDAQQVQGDAPHVKVFVPEGIDDEDFHGLVIFADGIVFLYEDGKKSYQLAGKDYFAIGSGSDFALAAMDAGADAERAVKVAMERDLYSGGELFVEELDPEPTELTREVAEGMDKGELISLLFGEEPVEVVEEQPDEKAKYSETVFIHTNSLVLNKDGHVVFLNSDNGSEIGNIDLLNSDLGSAPFNKVCKKLRRDYLDNIIKELYSKAALEDIVVPNKEAALDLILGYLAEELEQFLEEQDE